MGNHQLIRGVRCWLRPIFRLDMASHHSRLPLRGSGAASVHQGNSVSKHSAASLVWAGVRGFGRGNRSHGAYHEFSDVHRRSQRDGSHDVFRYHFLIRPGQSLCSHPAARDCSASRVDDPRFCHRLGDCHSPTHRGYVLCLDRFIAARVLWHCVLARLHLSSGHSGGLD